MTGRRRPSPRLGCPGAPATGSVTDSLARRSSGQAGTADAALRTAGDADAARRPARGGIGRAAGRPAGRPGGPPAGHPRLCGKRRDPAGDAASRRPLPADIPPTHKGRHVEQPGSPASIALGATAIPSAPVRQRPSAPAATIALGASTIASAPATRRLLAEPWPALARWRARGSRGATLGAGRPGLHGGSFRFSFVSRFALGFASRFASGFAPRPRPDAAIPRPGGDSRGPMPADIYTSHEHRHAGSTTSPAGSPATIALGATTIATAPATQRLSANGRHVRAVTGAAGGPVPARGPLSMWMRKGSP